MLYHEKMLARVFSATLAGASLFVSVPAAAQEAHGVIAFGYTGERPGVAYGFAWNFPAKYAAHVAAMSACVSGGGTDCIEVAWFQNICGALAMDQHGTAQGKPGMTQEQAEARALQGCESAAGAGCNIVGSVCSTPGGEPGTYSGSERVKPAQVAQTTVTEPSDESPAREEPAPSQDAQSAVTGPVDESLAREERKLIQQTLNFLGFDAGPADGVFGPRTLAAIYYWQRASDLETTGQLTRDQAAFLLAVEVPPEQEEESSPVPDVAAIPEQAQEAAGNVLIFGPETGPKCAARETTEDGHCWHELANKSGCFFLNRNNYFLDESVSWSGACTDGGVGLVAVGQGTLETDMDIWTGTMAYGDMQVNGSSEIMSRFAGQSDFDGDSARGESMLTCDTQPVGGSVCVEYDYRSASELRAAQDQCLRAGYATRLDASCPKGQGAAVCLHTTADSEAMTYDYEPDSSFASNCRATQGRYLGSR